MRLAAVRARVHPVRSPRASSRLARAMAASNDTRARSSARFTEPGVGWRSSCATRDCGAIGPASGLLADWRTAFSNCAIAVVQGPACAETAHRTQAAPATTTVNRRFMLCSNRWSPIANAVPLSTNQHPGSITAPRISRRVDGEMGSAAAVGTLRCGEDRPTWCRQRSHSRRAESAGE